MSLKNRKRIFLFIMALSYVPLFAFVRYSNLNDINTAVKFFAALAGMFGVIMMTWQYLLGVRGLISKLIPDLIWLNNYHKLFGTYGFLLIALHPVLMTIYYSTAGINLLIPSLATKFDQYRMLGDLGFVILLMTWLSSAFLRKTISFRWWKRIHLFNLVILPVILVHSLLIGTTLLTTNLRTYWYFIAIVVALIIIYRFILFKFLGFNRKRYTVVAVHKLTADVVQIDMVTDGRPITPNPGQFMYFHPLTSWETHPFTISRYSPESHIISVTVKDSGPFSKKVQDITAGTKIWLDGPYGVFTAEAYTTERPVVLVAGGIGVTPFIRLIEKINDGWDKRVILLYGNQTVADIAYADLINSVAAEHPNFTTTDILSRQADYTGETGYLDIDKIHKYVPGELSGYEYFVCGPVVMMKMVEAELTQAGVPKAQIHSEKFSL